MKIVIDLDDILKNNLSITDFLFLHLVYNQDYLMLEKYIRQNGKFFSKGSIDFLLSLNFLKFKDNNTEYKLSNFEVGEKFMIEFSNYYKDNTGKSDWVEEWYNLWPKNVKSGGYPLRSGLKGVKIKLEKFIKEFPEFSKELIIKSTKKYLDNAKLNNYKFTQLAHYFIYKNNMSTLAATCEAFEDDDNIEEVDYIYDI